jgi:hypothetical protein
MLRYGRDTPRPDVGLPSELTSQIDPSCPSLACWRMVASAVKLCKGVLAKPSNQVGYLSDSVDTSH